MPDAFSSPNCVALPITSQELGGGGGLFCPPTKIGLSNSPTTIGLIHPTLISLERRKIALLDDMLQIDSNLIIP